MKNKTGSFHLVVTLILMMALFCTCTQGGRLSEFRILAFHDGEHDQAHISFVKEADQWFSGIAQGYSFSYVSRNNWKKRNVDTDSR